MKITRALISVSDKTGIAEFARALSDFGVELIASGGTAKELEKAKPKLKVTPVEKVTGFPECLDGRVKTLHPRIHAAILADRGSKKHLAQLKKMKLKPIDMVCVNFYPFAEATEKQGTSVAHAIENIDIGGPAMVRAAAKNYGGVAAVTSPRQYPLLLQELRESRGKISIELRRKLANSAFELTAAYDAAVNNYLNSQKGFASSQFPRTLTLSFSKISDLRYGENPHQKAAFYRGNSADPATIADAKQLHGKELSYNNINDAATAIEVVKEFSAPCCAIVKHANPCGVATDEKLHVAFSKSLECDKESAFGGIIALNRECDAATAKQIIAFFNEVVIAPSYSEAALAELKAKKDLRILEIEGLEKRIGKGSPQAPRQNELRDVLGGMLVQERDIATPDEHNLRYPTSANPDSAQMKSLIFAWGVAKHVKSNAIVLAKGTQTIGIGAGQTSRVESVRLAIRRAKAEAAGCVMASDGFFPFPDSIGLAADANISAIIQPGGSVKDAEVIKACDERGIAMVFTRTRHFRH
ncbi:MAG: bifunctional phosphoribosylaminoimidazolecarboxamide formyltransferase/IMP cyclohydrolase [Candidatus Diapherotrites archaeon]